MSAYVYKIGKMDCANCAKEVEEGVCRLPGVESAEVDFFSGKLRLNGDVAFDTLNARVEALGKTIALPDEVRPEPVTSSPGGVRGFWRYLLAERETQFALAGGGIILVALAASWAGLAQSAVNALYVAGMLTGLWPILRSGINGLRINRRFNINLLMSIAAVGAVVIGEYLEGALVVFLFAVGEALEGYTADRARKSIENLFSLTPKTALRLTGATGDEEEERVPVEALRVGDRILVKPGVNIPMDGRVLSGVSSVNQAPITGESVPVAKEPGDALFAGTINGSGALIVEVTHPAADNTIQRIIAMVEEAQSRRAPSQRVIDRFAAWYTPAVVVLAALVATVPPLFFGAPFFDPPAGDHGWLYRALAMLVIACPCALVISTPVTIISAITRAAKEGVLIKGGAHLEMLGKVKAVALDKTGTLTIGHPAVTEIHAVDCMEPEASHDECAQCTDLLALAAAVERRTSHPLADAVMEAAVAQEVAERYPPARNVELLAGKGVRGRVDERLVTVGSHPYFDAEFSHAATLCEQVRAREAQGRTTMLVADDSTVRGYITLLDEPRPHAQSVIAQLNELGLATAMLTGDNPKAAAAIAEEIGVTDVYASLLPAEKVVEVEKLVRRYGQAAMVGDGVNDTPALAAASVGIAMGGAGTPQALETADIALMADDLTQLPAAIRLARFARRLIRQNVILSFGVKLVFLLLALGGLTSLWLAILADVGMALLVTLNGMRAGRV